MFSEDNQSKTFKLLNPELGSLDIGKPKVPEVNSIKGLKPAEYIGSNLNCVI